MASFTARIQHGLRRLERRAQVARFSRGADSIVAARMRRVRDLGRSLRPTAGEHAVPGDPSLDPAWERVMWARYLWARSKARGRVVLDVGCGYGWGAFLLADVARAVVALDRHRGVLAASRTALPANGLLRLVGDLDSLPLPDGSVDLVLCMELIEHLEVPAMRRLLREVHRVLRPGGALLGSSAFPATEPEASRLCARNPYHLHVYTAGEWLGELRAAFANGRLVGDLWFEAERREPT